MLALREAAYRNREDARLWVFYGVQCARIGHWDFAEEALKHAAWLRERRHEPRKAAVTRALIERLARAA